MALTRRLLCTYILRIQIFLLESVFCCALHPAGTHVATGGEDDRLVVRDAAKDFALDFESGDGAFKGPFSFDVRKLTRFFLSLTSMSAICY